MLSLMRDGIKPSDRIEPFRAGKGVLREGFGQLAATNVGKRSSGGIRAANEQHDGVSIDRFLSSDRSHFFAGLGFDIDLTDIESQQVCNSRGNRVLVRGQLGSLGMDRAIEIADRPATLSHFIDGGKQKMSRVGVAPLRIGIRKPLTDITQSGSAEDGIRDGMQQDISITVSVKPEFILDRHTPQDQRTTRDQSMPVVPQSYSNARIAHRALSTSNPCPDSTL